MGGFRDVRIRGMPPSIFAMFVARFSLLLAYAAGAMYTVESDGKSVVRRATVEDSTKNDRNLEVLVERPGEPWRGASHAVEIDAKSVVRRVYLDSSTKDDRDVGVFVERRKEPLGQASHIVEDRAINVMKRRASHDNLTNDVLRGDLGALVEEEEKKGQLTQDSAKNDRGLEVLVEQRAHSLGGERLQIEAWSEPQLNATGVRLLAPTSVGLFAPTSGVGTLLKYCIAIAIIAATMIGCRMFVLPFLHRNQVFSHVSHQISLLQGAMAESESLRTISIRQPSPSPGRSSSIRRSPSEVERENAKGHDHVSHTTLRVERKHPDSYSRMRSQTSQACCKHIEGSTTFVKRTRALWSNQGLDVQDKVNAVLTDVLSQTALGYDTLNGACNLEAALNKYGVRTDRHNVGAASRRGLQKEIDEGKCRMLLVQPQPHESQLVRLVRIIKLDLFARTAKGERVLCEATQSRSAHAHPRSGVQASVEDHDLKYWFKVSIEDGEDAQAALQTHLVKTFGLGIEWQDRNIFLVKMKPPELQQKESLQFPGLVTWYLVEPMVVVLGEISSKDGAAIGLPAGAEFTTKILKHSNRMLREFRTWTWMDASFGSDSQVTTRSKDTHTFEKQEIGSAVERATAMRAWAKGVSSEWRAKQQRISSDVLRFVTEIQEQTQEEYEMVNDPSHMEDTLTEFGIDVDVDALQDEVNHGRCQLLMANPLNSSSAVEQIVRLVRILRVKLKADTTNGKRVLVEAARVAKI
jgi:hypothetical protein